MVKKLEHYMNPLHIYCRLRDFGLPKNSAICFCRIYELKIFKYLLTSRDNSSVSEKHAADSGNLEGEKNEVRRDRV
jgi:hypothetical protein